MPFLIFFSSLMIACCLYILVRICVLQFGEKIYKPDKKMILSLMGKGKDILQKEGKKKAEKVYKEGKNFIKELFKKEEDPPEYKEENGIW